MYEVLKSELQSIVELVETLPDRYKDRCFDLLLSSLLADQRPADGDEAVTPPATEHGETPGSKAPPTPAKVRAFMGRTGVTDEDLRRLVLIEGGELHFIQEPEVTQNAVGQIQWALLLALKAGLLTGEMEVDAEGVRSVCIEKGLYDKGNFASNFKVKKNAAFFQSPPEPQGAAVKLSSPGEKKLAELIKSLVG